jgi:hypothetical protein
LNQSAAKVWPEKHPADVLDYGFDFEQDCAREWHAWTDYASGERIRVYTAGGGSGFEFECIVAGRTAGRPPPSWPTVLGSTITTGSTTWIARALSSASLLRTLVGVPTWVADSGITAANPRISGLIAIADLSGGDDGKDYAVTCTATDSNGLAIVKVAILPVRIPVRRVS